MLLTGGTAWAERDRLGSFEVSGPGGDGSLGVGFATQLRLTVDDNEGEEADGAIEMGRIRTVLRGKFLEDRLEFGLQLNTSPRSLEFLDLFANYTVSENLEVRTGQWKTPFTRYRLHSFTALALVDWALVTRYYGNERQVGAMVHNQGGTAKRVEYAAGVFTGETARAAHGVGLYEVYGERPFSTSDLGKQLTPEPPHPELIASISYSTPGMDVSTNSDATGGGLRYSFTFSGAWDVRPTHARDLSFRFAPEALVHYRGLSALAVAYLGMFEDLGGDQHVGLPGGLIEVAYRVVPKVEVAARFARVDRSDALREDARARANQRILEAPLGERAALIRQYALVDVINAQQQAGIGVNYYILGNSLKWQADLHWWQTRKLAVAEQDDYQLRTQLQIVF